MQRAQVDDRRSQRKGVRRVGVGLAVALGVLGSSVGAVAAQSEPEQPPTSTTVPTTSAPPSTMTAPPTTVAPTTTAPTTTAAPATTSAPAAPSGAGDSRSPGEGSGAPTTTTALRPDADPASPTTTMPTSTPEGFTDEQFDTFVSVVRACGSQPGAVCQQVLEWTGNRSLAEAAQWFTSVPLAVAAVIGAAFLANRLVRRGIRRYLRRLDARVANATDGPVADKLISERRALRMATISSTLGSAASVVIFVVALFVALAQFDISLGPLLAGAGIVGAALGFGAQNIVRDFLAGLFVTIEDQYGVGDIIDAGRASGVVEGITLRMTKLRDVEGTLWFVPNGEIKEVGNMTQRWSRVILDVAVAYEADHHQAGRIIKEAADAMWQDPASGARILEEPELWGVEALGETSLVIRVAVKSYPADQWLAARELRSRIKDAFDEAGIEIPVPPYAMWGRPGQGVDGSDQSVSAVR